MTPPPAAPPTSPSLDAPGAHLVRARPAARGRGPGATVAVVALVVVATVVSAATYAWAVAGRGAVEQRAVANARAIQAVEVATGLDAITGWAEGPLADGPARVVLATVYGLGYWPFLVLAAVVARRRDRRAFWRFALAVSTSGLVGILAMALLPVAPPRLVGFPDAMVGSPLRPIAHPDGVFNPYGAMPSFHVAWSAIAAAAIAASVRRPWVRRLAWGQPVAMTVAVVATGNHWALDVVAGAGLAVLAWAGSAPLARLVAAHLGRPGGRAVAAPGLISGRPPCRGGAGRGPGGVGRGGSAGCGPGCSAARR